MAGTTFELVLLSSSPPPSSSVTIASPPSTQQRVRMSTLPPAAPSTPRSWNVKTSGALTSGSRAVPVPEGAARGFATAGSLVKSHRFTPDLFQGQAAVPHSQLRPNPLQNAHTTLKSPKESSKRAAKPAAEDDGADPKPRKPRARKLKANKDEHMQDAIPQDPVPKTSSHSVDTLAAEPPYQPTDDPAAPFGYTKLGKPRKRRAPKEKSDNGETQTTIPQAKITKPRSKTNVAPKKARTATEVVSSHFALETENALIARGSGAENVEGTHVTADSDNTTWDVPPSPSHKNMAPKRRKQVEQALELQKADSRRRDWTPTKDTTSHKAFTESSGEKNHSSCSLEDSVPFPNLVSDFSYAQLETRPPAVPKAPISTAIGMTKKRRVELVDLPSIQCASRSNVSPEKGKMPKKKPRTITDFVTDQYAAPKELDPQSSITSEFFAARTTSITTKVPLNDSSDSTAKKSNVKPPRKRASSKLSSEIEAVKPKPKAKKASTKIAAKPKLIADKLLSPASALLKISRQDVLFGTSSQLALEESPTLIRHIQQAIKESEEDTDILPCIAGAKGAMCPPLWPRLDRVQGKRGLWAASARGDGGRLLEKLDDVYIPAPDRTDDLPLLMDGSYDDDPNTSFADVNDIPLQMSSDLPLPAEPLIEGAGSFLKDVGPLLKNESGYDMASDDDINKHGQVPPPSNQKAESSFLNIDDFPFQSHTPADHSLVAISNSETSFLDIDDFSPHSPLIKAHASMPSPQRTSTCSPKKRRGQPPKSYSTIPAKTRTTPIKKPSKTMSVSGRPSTPKSSKGRFADVEEILDSEDDEALSPTPPRINRSLDSALPLIPSMAPMAPNLSNPSDPANSLKPAKTVTTMSTISHAEPPEVFQVPLAQLEWATSKFDVFSKIASTIRALPPTTIPKQPSWLEKILLYDAIVLEDLTSYLTKHTSVRVFKRATQKQVKAWNKALAVRGEKALPEVGLGIGAKVGDKGEELLNVVEKEVEVYMVKEWCQEMSVCGISKIRGGRSGMGKGLY